MHRFFNAEYDRLIAAAAKEPNTEKRKKLFESAERILMDDMPIIPLYFYVSKNMVRPHVRGFYNNLQDNHPLADIWIDRHIKNTIPIPERVHGAGKVTWFIVRRFFGLVFTLWCVFTVTFLLEHAVPGGPYSGERKMPPEILANFKHRYRLDLPLWEQYLFEMKRDLSGDLGDSMRLYDFNVNTIIAQGLPISAALGIFALAYAIALGVSAGIVSAMYRGSLADLWLMSLATVGIAIPNFVIAGLAILLFVFAIPIFPAAGWGTFRQLVLPAICLGTVYAAEIARITRTGMLNALSQDYVRTARARA